VSDKVQQDEAIDMAKVLKKLDVIPFRLLALVVLSRIPVRKPGKY
jgi:hypothetical protein